MSVSTKPYIGTRDFYPEDMAFRSWMFGIQRRVCERYGYVEYSAPTIEPLSLYQAKSSEEIVNEQIYRFTDRGEREVAIRPEMTPTLARMVAAKSAQMIRPLRWYSIGNFMRYERPGRGRLREFFQLNADLIGSASPGADAEILTLAADLLFEYGARKEDFTLRYSDRRLFESYLKNVPVERLRSIGRLLDKREKIGPEEFERQLAVECPDRAEAQKVQRYLALEADELVGLTEKGELDAAAVAHLDAVRKLCEESMPGVLKFDPGIVRGFDYYTGLIFEINDNDPENRRALFGGGRYDRLLGLFGKEQIPAVGFGMGDVTLEQFIESRGLKPSGLSDKTGVFVALFSESMRGQCAAIAGELRKQGIQAEVSLDATGKFGKQLELAERKNHRYVLIYGEDEAKKGLVRIKDLKSGEQKDIEKANLVGFLKSHL